MKLFLITLAFVAIIAAWLYNVPAAAPVKKIDLAQAKRDSLHEEFRILNKKMNSHFRERIYKNGKCVYADSIKEY